MSCRSRLLAFWSLAGSEVPSKKSKKGKQKQKQKQKKIQGGSAGQKWGARPNKKSKKRKTNIGTGCHACASIFLCLFFITRAPRPAQAICQPSCATGFLFFIFCFNARAFRPHRGLRARNRLCGAGSARGRNEKKHK